MKRRHDRVSQNDADSDVQPDKKRRKIESLSDRKAGIILAMIECGNNNSPIHYRKLSELIFKNQKRYKCHIKTPLSCRTGTNLYSKQMVEKGIIKGIGNGIYCFKKDTDYSTVYKLLSISPIPNSNKKSNIHDDLSKNERGFHNLENMNLDDPIKKKKKGPNYESCRINAPIFSMSQVQAETCNDIKCSKSLYQCSVCSNFSCFHYMRENFCNVCFDKEKRKQRHLAFSKKLLNQISSL